MCLLYHFSPSSQSTAGVCDLRGADAQPWWGGVWQQQVHVMCIKPTFMYWYCMLCIKPTLLYWYCMLCIKPTFLYWCSILMGWCMSCGNNRCTHIHTYTHTHTLTHTYIHIHIHTHTHTYIHIHIHTYTHTHMVCGNNRCSLAGVDLNRQWKSPHKVCVCVYVCVFMCMCKYVCVCVCVWYIIVEEPAQGMTSIKPTYYAHIHLLNPPLCTDSVY
jgi:hypothetical protein